MNVRLPDGTIIENVPDGTTKADLVKKLQTNGMAVPAEWLADTAPPAPPTDRQRLLSSAPMRVAKGMKDPIDGAAQLLRRGVDGLSNAMPGGALIRRAVGNPAELIDKAANAIGGEGTFVGDVLGIKGATPQQLDADVRASEAEYEGARKAAGQQGADVARLVGNVLSPANVGAARLVPAPRVGAPVSTLARQGAAAGAAGAALQPVTGENFGGEKALQVGVGAAGGAVLAPLMTRAAESIARTVRERARTGTVLPPEAIQHEIRASFARDDIDIGQIPRNVMDQLTRQVQEAMASGQEVNAAALLRRLDFERLGVQPTLGQITRDPTQFARERDLRGIQGVGEPIANRLNQQAQQLTTLLRRGTGNQQTPHDAGQSLIGMLQGRDRAMQNDVRSAYGAFRESTGRDIEIPLQGLAQDYANTLRDFGDTIPSAVRRQFEGLGLLSGTQRRLMTIEDAERLIQTINKNYDPSNRAQARALDELRRGVQGSILGVTDTGAGMEAGTLANMARDTARQRFQTIESVPALRAAINDAAPDDFVKKYVVNGKVREITQMAELLGDDGRRTMAQQTMAYLQQKAFGSNAAGDGAARQARFNDELQKIGRNKLEALLGPQQTEELYAIGRVMAYIQEQPAGSAVNNSNTGAAVANLLSKIGGTVRGTPYINDFVVRPLAAARERGEVQNALAAALRQQSAEIEPQVVNELARWLRPVPVAGGAALGYSVR